MKFLTKLLQILGKGAQIAGLFQPLVSQESPKAGVVVQTISKDIAEGMQVIVDAEKIAASLGSNVSGEEKLKIAIPLMSDVILQSAALSGHTIANVDLYNQGVSKLTDGMADIVNSLHPDGLVVVDKTKSQVTPVA